MGAVKVLLMVFLNKTDVTEQWHYIFLQSNIGEVYPKARSGALEKNTDKA